MVLENEKKDGVWLGVEILGAEIYKELLGDIEAGSRLLIFRTTLRSKP